MNKTLILIAGMPGTGKTRFANFLSDRLQLILICKDRLKEIIWDEIHFDSKVRSESQKYGKLAYALSFHFCEMIMRSEQSIVFESNFMNPCPDILKSMVNRYGYNVITVLFDGEVEVIHKRFLERDSTKERHTGLFSGSYFSDFEIFKTATEPCRNFDYGDFRIIVDATDFSKVSYDDIIERILSRE